MEGTSLLHLNSDEAGVEMGHPDGVVDRVVAVDWSGDKSAAGQRRKIWAGVWTRSDKGRTAGGLVTLEAGRTRAELMTWLIEMAAETPRMVVGIDLCFSYPAWFLAEHRCPTVFDLWRHVAAGHGERWLGEGAAELERDVRFWGKPHKRPAEFSGEHLHRQMRRTDVDNKIAPRLAGGNPARAAKMLGITPKSPFQIGGSGSVGTGSLRGMPHLLELHAAGFRVWPFEDAALDRDKPLLVEIYTRLLTGPVAKSNADARSAYLKLRRSDAAFKGLSREVSARANSSEDAFDALVCCLEMVRSQHAFSALRATEDRELLLEGITWWPGANELG